MAGLSETGIQRRIDWPLVPSDPDAWLPVVPRHDDVATDALLDWIENSDVDTRFVPDWPDESFRDAA